MTMMSRGDSGRRGWSGRSPKRKRHGQNGDVSTRLYIKEGQCSLLGLVNFEDWVFKSSPYLSVYLIF